MKKKILIVSIILVLFFFIAYYLKDIIFYKEYNASYFHIEVYKSSIDKDQDGIDDQTDFLNGVKAYIATKPKYKSKYYATGYPTDHYGVCTDVVINGFRSAGYDIMELVNEDIKENQKLYNIEIIDKNIDFRRVRNLEIYLKRHAISLTTDVQEISLWQEGDIVVFKNHIGVLSDKRNKKGIPFLIHHESPYQLHLEEDVLEDFTILGHYRIS